MKSIKVIIFGLLLIGFFGFSQLEASAHAPDMHSGSTGQNVSELQSTLKKLGYFKTNVTGYYGPVTENAVIKFQRDFGVSATGYTGPATRSMLDKVNMMARVVHGEARGESYTGKIAVAAVILNRVDSSQFPDTIDKVIFQRNAFTAVNDGQYWLTPNSSAYQAVRDAMRGSDPSSGATYYYNPAHVSDSWIFTRDFIKQIGKHHFAQ
ncbi:cell wall hydrolase [Planococcus sp. N028]|uniref:Cell wall hydrolase n=1 Tax=Planococcus shixiaomingii TaxID=3058393 RepID=A0ABT8N4B4_9BACL|nr:MULTISPECIES: cell wall hydrolase [unclassified Planococcus (in: firmicutes)]MDN7242721.1 cell wall hydrolase [Planococcus sp. N028]WKA55651.1 cell wall hydrolase [Planococcus sp. N022]